MTKKIDKDKLDRKTVYEDGEEYGDAIWFDIHYSGSDRYVHSLYTRAMEIQGLGCLVKVTTIMNKLFAENVTWVPGAKIKVKADGSYYLG